MTSAPSSLLLVRPDGMGDLILFEPALNALIVAWPTTRVIVLVRHSLRELGALLFPTVSWIGVPIDPFRQAPGAVSVELAQLQTTLLELNPAWVIACAEERNWLDLVVAAMLPQARTMALGSGKDPVHFGPQLRALYPHLSIPAFAEVASVRSGELAWVRAGGLVDRLLGQKVVLEAPRWSRPTRPALPTSIPIESSGQPYVVCAAAGFANVPLKTWPADRYVAVLQWLGQERGIAAVLVGSGSERAYLQEIAAKCGASVWISDPPNWLKLLGLIAHSQAVLGNDTGLLHMAVALNRPVVGIYGGGTWPRFIPAGPGAVVVNPLPCFGCGWDCAFGDAPCITAVAPAEVQSALAHVLEGPKQSECAVVETHHFLPETAAMMGLAAARYWALSAELNRRERHFQETVRLASGKDGEIRALKAATDDKDDEIQQLKQETDHKDREIVALKRESDRRDQRAESIQAEAELRSMEIEKLHKAGEELQKACAELQKACDERLALIIRLDAELKAATGRGA